MMSSLSPKIARLLSCKKIGNCCRTICATRKQQSFHESDRKSGYPQISDYKEERQNTWQSIRQGYKYFVEEMKILKEECKEKFRMDPIVVFRPGEVDVTWKFNGDPNILNQWVVTSDSDYGEGNSIANFELSPTGTGVFSGNLDPREFKDGKIKRTGYCNIKSVRPRKSFKRESFLDWGPYNHFVMRMRGDGRNYLLTLACPGDYDLLWNDSYQYVLHTRGGPYWQYVRIPFSKFFFVSKGRVQDIQQPVPTHLIAYLSITAADSIPGNFKLEFDFIGVECDPTYQEEFAYEMYRPPTKFHV